MPKVLVSWVGAADLEGGAEGPIASILKSKGRDLDRAVLLVNQSGRDAEVWANQLPLPSTVVRVALDSPIDYLEVFEATRRVLEDHVPRDDTLLINLTSGTKTMAACLLLLGRSVRQAQFVQTYEGSTREEEVPSVLIECIPDVLQAQQSALGSFLTRDMSMANGFSGITGSSPALAVCLQKASRIAPLDYSVLLLGETGVGKEVFAQAIHQSSGRCDAPFVPVNCASIPRDLQESELFGHTKGSFTGATADRKGLFHQADGGTLFLDEFGELSPNTQASLLRALQPGQGRPLTERNIRRIGSTSDETVDVRIVAATNRPLSEVRQDLVRRLPFILELPALRDRKSDIPALITQFLDEIAQELAQVGDGLPTDRFQVTDEGLRFLMRYSWPGNVRELRNCLAEACVYSATSVLDVPIFEQCLHHTGHSASEALPEISEDFEIDRYLAKQALEIYERALDLYPNMSQAAASIGLSSDQKLRDRIKAAKKKIGNTNY